MKNFRLSRSYVIAAVLTLAVFGWLIVMGMIVVDSIIGNQPAPTAASTVVSVLPTRNIPMISATMTSTATAHPTASPLPPTLTLTVVLIQPTTIVTDSPTAAATDSVAPASGTSASTGCKTPAGWTAYTVEEGDTIFGFVLGSKSTLTVDSIMTANCLTTNFLSVGQTIFLPPGVADESPKVDSAPAPIAAAPVSAAGFGLTRTANCPCSISVRAGWRLEQIAAAIDAEPVGFSGAAFMATVAAGAAVPDLAFLSSRPGGKSLEGFMFPGTYTLDNSTTAVQFRDMLLNAFAANVGGQVQADASAHGLTFWEAVVLASIIQKESGAPSEQVLIASVFHNRIAQKKGLAATVTLQYALGRAGNWWPRVKSVNMDSPYNTHLNLGLPPSPIASPGLSAIMAAVYPAQTDYLYFSGKCGGGGNFYAATFKEFEQGLACK